MEVRRRPASSTRPSSSATAPRLPRTPPQKQASSTPTSPRATASYHLGDEDDEDDKGTAPATTQEAKGRGLPRTRSYGAVTQRKCPGEGESPDRQIAGSRLLCMPESKQLSRDCEIQSWLTVRAGRAPDPGLYACARPRHSRDTVKSRG